MNHICSIISILVLIIQNCSANINPRVLELNDRFLEIKRDGNWLVMFYAPWCAYCRRLEPIWSHVQQTLHNTNIRVCRMDCVSHKNACSKFLIRTYPTIMFLKGDESQFIYSGDRNTEDIVHFALRVANPPVRQIRDGEHLNRLKKDGIIFFTFVGDADGELWDSFSAAAIQFQQHSYFYQIPSDVAQKHYQEFSMPSITVHKENIIDEFNGKMYENVNTSLIRWISEERFPSFVKITRFNINTLMETSKYLVMVVVEESKVQEIPPHMKEFRNMVESVIKNNRERFHKHFQFGWVGSPDIANSIAIMKVPLPYLLVYNSSTRHHHIPEDEPHQLTPEAVSVFLESIRNQTAKAYGGNGFMIAINRFIFESLTAATEMWLGNPILMSVLFGLPLGFLLLIFYSIYCVDIMDADEDDANEDLLEHEKNE